MPMKNALALYAQLNSEIIPRLCLQSALWRNGSALVFGTKGCRFEPCQGRVFFLNLRGRRALFFLSVLQSLLLLLNGQWAEDIRSILPHLLRRRLPVQKRMQFALRVIRA